MDHIKSPPSDRVLFCVLVSLTGALWLSINHSEANFGNQKIQSQIMTNSRYDTETELGKYVRHALFEEEMKEIKNLLEIDKGIYTESRSDTTIDVCLIMPYLDRRPVNSANYIPVLEWALLYSSQPVTFHIITNAQSAHLIEKVFMKVKPVANVSVSVNFLDYHQQINQMSSQTEDKQTICSVVGVFCLYLQLAKTFNSLQKLILVNTISPTGRFPVHHFDLATIESIYKQGNGEPYFMLIGEKRKIDDPIIVDLATVNDTQIISSTGIIYFNLERLRSDFTSIITDETLLEMIQTREISVQDQTLTGLVMRMLAARFQDKVVFATQR